MGTGKSSVGRVLAKMTGMFFQDLDSLIVAETGRSINEIFSAEGEAYFRTLETAELHKLVRSENLILSTGGGAVLAAENQELIRNLGVVINLMAPPEVIAQRLRHANDRPLLNDGASRERIERMLVEREPCYAMAHIRIDTTGKKIEDVAAIILKHIDSIETDKRV